MAIDADFVRSIAPETTNVSNDILEFWIQQAYLMVDLTKWGDKADFATGLLTAHLYTSIYSRNGASGSVRRETVGDLEIEYAVADGDDGLDSTAYGQQYKVLRKSLVITPMVAGCLVT